MFFSFSPLRNNLWVSEEAPHILTLLISDFRIVIEGVAICRPLSFPLPVGGAEGELRPRGKRSHHQSQESPCYAGRMRQDDTVAAQMEHDSQSSSRQKLAFSTHKFFKRTSFSFCRLRGPGVVLWNCGKLAASSLASAPQPRPGEFSKRCEQVCVHATTGRLPAGSQRGHRPGHSASFPQPFHGAARRKRRRRSPWTRASVPSRRRRTVTRSLGRGPWRPSRIW